MVPQYAQHHLLGDGVGELERSAAPDGEAVGARVLLTSSLTHRAGRLDFADLQAEARYHPLGQYAATKLAAIVLARDLQRRFDQCVRSTRCPCTRLPSHRWLGMFQSGLAVRTGSLGNEDRLIAPMVPHRWCVLRGQGVPVSPT